ncbi:unnamed protein product [Phaedon cochleariae]|uniref:CHK kinase-like domain-containing protein n=1 Tax=Phaedon cochleariae TaxID=80249 RepID=A0A9P0GUV1_PHACE|nr:unnamed protein product [Phaedon cochleariae]
MDFQLRNLSELLKKNLGPDVVIKETKITRLTPPGENFGSVMLKLDVTFGNKKNDSEEILYAVAKILPETEMFREIFQIQITYTNEMAFYETIVPTLQSFQKGIGIQEVIELFPKCIATRKNLTGGNEIDDDAVLILENLIQLGYQNIDRCQGFDFETTKMVLKDMASFHAVPLALKIRNPYVFEKKIKVHCHDFDPPDHEEFHDILRNIVKFNEELAYLAPKITYWGQLKRSTPREPFATMIHTDLWTNNTMQKFHNGRPVSNKFVDFQVFTYGSPAADVFFFLWSSVPQEVLEPNLEFFLQYYHEQFIDVLKKHGIDVAPFSYEHFLKELDIESEYGFSHAAHFYVNTVSREKGDIDFENQDSQDIVNSTSQRTREKVWYMTRECLRRGWLK